MQKNIAGQDVDVDVEGYLTDMHQWNGEIAKGIASELGINELTQQHWDVIDWLRQQSDQGMQNEIEAFKAGVIIEERDIKDITNQLATTSDQDVVDALESLRSGSENHLRAFNKQL